MLALVLVLARSTSCRWLDEIQQIRRECDCTLACKKHCDEACTELNELCQHQNRKWSNFKARQILESLSHMYCY